MRHSNPNALMISCMPCIIQWFLPLIRLPRLTSGRLGPSKTKSGKNGALMSLVHLKNSVRSSGFSPSRP